MAKYLCSALKFEVFTLGTLGVHISRLISRQGGLPGRLVFMCSTVLRGWRRMDSSLNRSNLSESRYFSVAKTRERFDRFKEEAILRQPPNTGTTLKVYIQTAFHCSSLPCSQSMQLPNPFPVPERLALKPNYMSQHGRVRRVLPSTNTATNT